jgi:3-hydroxyisobutyrate dehydrogenase-like beta-hydroxyacid dehydrogenase
VRIGILHPGDMGSAVGAALVRAGHRVGWASEGRSPATGARAAADGLVDAGTVRALAGTSDMLVSICPPHAALDVASAVGPFAGIYIDANAIAPATTRRVGQVVVDGDGRFVDGGIIGPPPRRPGTTRLYLSGPDAIEASEAFATPDLETHVVSAWPGAASGLKLAYAAWTKGTAALLLAVRAAAEAEGVADWLLDEWRISQSELAERSLGAARSAVTKGWRWDGEMEEVAAMFEADGLPGGFGRAAAEVYRRAPTRPEGDDGERALDAVIAALRRVAPPGTDTPFGRPVDTAGPGPAAGRGAPGPAAPDGPE